MNLIHKLFNILNQDTQLYFFKNASDKKINKKFYSHDKELTKEKINFLSVDQIRKINNGEAVWHETLGIIAPNHEKALDIYYEENGKDDIFEIKYNEETDELTYKNFTVRTYNNSMDLVTGVGVYDDGEDMWFGVNDNSLGPIVWLPKEKKEKNQELYMLNPDDLLKKYR